MKRRRSKNAQEINIATLVKYLARTITNKVFMRHDGNFKEGVFRMGIAFLNTQESTKRTCRLAATKNIRTQIWSAFATPTNAIARYYMILQSRTSVCSNCAVNLIIISYSLQFCFQISLQTFLATSIGQDQRSINAKENLLSGSSEVKTGLMLPIMTLLAILFWKFH